MPAICLRLCLALWPWSHWFGAISGKTRDGVLFHLSWKALALHVSSLSKPIQGVSLPLKILPKNMLRYNKQFGAALGLAD